MRDPVSGRGPAGAVGDRNRTEIRTSVHSGPTVLEVRESVQHGRSCVRAPDALGCLDVKASPGMTRPDADVAALAAALAADGNSLKKELASDLYPAMELGSAVSELEKIFRGERAQALLRALAWLGRRGQLQQFPDALAKLAEEETLASLVAEVRRQAKQLELFGGDFIELAARVEERVASEQRGEVLPFRRKDGGG